MKELTLSWKTKYGILEGSGVTFPFVSYIRLKDLRSKEYITKKYENTKQ